MVRSRWTRLYNSCMSKRTLEATYISTCKEYKYYNRSLPFSKVLSLFTREDTLRSIVLSPKSTTIPPKMPGLT